MCLGGGLHVGVGYGVIVLIVAQSYAIAFNLASNGVTFFSFTQYFFVCYYCVAFYWVLRRVVGFVGWHFGAGLAPMVGLG